MMKVKSILSILLIGITLGCSSTKQISSPFNCSLIPTPLKDFKIDIFGNIYTIDQTLRALPEVSMSRSDYHTKTYLGFLHSGQTLTEADFRQQLNALGFDLACFETGTYAQDTFVRLSLDACPDAQ